MTARGERLVLPSGRLVQGTVTRGLECDWIAYRLGRPAAKPRQAKPKDTKR